MLHCFPSLAKGLGVPVEEWHGNARLGIRYAQSFQDRLDQLRYPVTRQTAYSQAAAEGGAASCRVAWSCAMRRRGGIRCRVPVGRQQVRLVDDREMRPLLDGGEIFGRRWLTAVEAGEALGFLPGDLKEKIDPYLRPLYDALDDMIPSDKLNYYMANRIIEIAPLAYMRGRTLDNAFIILDEAQNSTDLQLKMFLTRIGASAKAIITGDLSQIDLPKNQKSGLFKATRILQNIDGIAQIKLDEADVVRHRLVKQIIRAYDSDKAREEELEKKREAKRD